MQTKYKQTEIGKIPKDWSVFPLSQIVNIISGGTPKTTESKYWNGDIPWLSIVDFNSGSRFVYETEKSITEEGLRNSSAQLLKNGQVVISARGTVGVISQVEKDMAFNQSCYGLDAKELLSNDFLYYLLKHQIDSIKQKTHGSVFNTITKETFNNITVVVPLKREQDDIVNILSSFDDKIELNRKMNETLEEIGKALFNRWFVDFEFPFDFAQGKPNLDGKPLPAEVLTKAGYKSSGGKMVDSELGEIRESWRVEKLSDFGKVVCGKTPPKSDPDYFGGETPFIKIPDMHDKTFIVKTEDMLSKKGKNFQQNKTLPKFSLCVSCIATVGLVCITSLESQTNQQINSIIPNERKYLPYLYFQLRRMERKLIDYASGGSATPNLNTGDFADLSIVFPQNKILNSFFTVVWPLFEQILNNDLENSSLEQIRDSFLPRLMSGKLRVTV